MIHFIYLLITYQIEPTFELSKEFISVFIKYFLQELFRSKTIILRISMMSSFVFRCTITYPIQTFISQLIWGPGRFTLCFSIHQQYFGKTINRCNTSTLSRCHTTVITIFINSRSLHDSTRIRYIPIINSESSNKIEILTCIIRMIFIEYRVGCIISPAAFFLNEV